MRPQGEVIQHAMLTRYFDSRSQDRREQVGFAGVTLQMRLPHSAVIVQRHSFPHDIVILKLDSSSDRTPSSIP
jgi:hypothetical protein